MRVGRESEPPPLFAAATVAPVTAAQPTPQVTPVAEQNVTLSGHNTPDQGADAAWLAWEHGVDGYAIVRSGVFTAANPAFEALVGRATDDIVTKYVTEVFAADDIAPILDRPNDSDSTPVAGLFENGVPFLAEVSSSSTADGAVVLQARRRLPTIVAGPDEPTASDDAVAAALSHDLRGRLGVVSGFLDLVATSDSEALGEHRPILERASGAAESVDLMLEQLVRFIRLGDSVFHLTPTSLDQVVVDAAAAAGVEISTSGGALPTVFANVALLHGCLTELFRNAAEYRDPETALTIDVSATTADRWCELTIADNGKGLPPHLVEESLGLFRQLQPRNWDRGVGMGLALCNRIIDGHGGRLSIRENEPAGTSVSLRLALAEPVA